MPDLKSVVCVQKHLSEIQNYLLNTVFVAFFFYIAFSLVFETFFDLDWN